MRSMKQIRRGDRHNHNVSHSKLRRRGAGAKNKHASNKKWQQSAVLPSEAARKAQIAAIFAAALAAEYIPEDVTPEQLKKIAEKKEAQRKAEEARAAEDKKKAAAEKAKKEEQKKAEKAEKKKQQEAAAAAKAAQAAADAQKAEEEKKAKKEQARLEEQKNAEEKAKKKAEQQAEAAKDAKKNKKNKKASESQVEEPVAKVEVAPAEAAAPESKKNKKSKKNSESHAEEPKAVVEEPVAKIEVAPVEAAAPEPAQGGKKNKKNKKNSESQPEEAKAEVVEEPVAKVEAPVVEAAPAPAENGKKNKKGKKTPRNSESHDEPKPVEVVEEAAVKVEAKPVEAVQEIPYPQAEHNAESGNGKKKNKKGKKNSESEGQTVILPPSEPAAEATAVDIPLNGQPKENKEDAPAGTMINGDHNEPDSTGGKNKKKRNKKKSQGHSISEDAPSGAAPIQVNEVSSTDAPVNVQTESLKETITIAQEVDSQMSPTQFAQNVQKLVDSTLKQKGVDAHDESVKLTIEAQLLKLQEKKVPTVHLEYKPITLPILQASPRPARVVSERVYKLLPKDIIYCSEMIEHYGTDFKAMVKDPRNVNRETERSLQRKIRVFKESPHFAVYERAKAEGRPIAEVVAESDI